MRFWLEPREGDSRSPQVRGYVRSLKTGEQRLLNNPDELAQLIKGQLQTALEGLDRESRRVEDVEG